MMEKEIRIVPFEDSEVRASKDSRTIEGRGIVFNKESKDLGGFREKILPEAIDGVLENSDVLALLNHNILRGVLARSTKGKGTLELRADKKGVSYSFDAPAFDLGDEVLEGVRRGDIRESSFGFAVEEDHWDELPDGSYLRTIIKFREIYDMSPCYFPAYDDTKVAVRSLDTFKTELAEHKEGVKPDAEGPAPEPITETEWKPSPEERFLRHGGILIT